MRARADAGRGVHLLLRAARAVEQQRRVAHQHLPGGRERHAARITLEQPRPEAALEPGDVLGDRGLREVQRGGRLGERAAHSDPRGRW